MRAVWRATRKQHISNSCAKTDLEAFLTFKAKARAAATPPEARLEDRLVPTLSLRQIGEYLQEQSMHIRGIRRRTGGGV